MQNTQEKSKVSLEVSFGRIEAHQDYARFLIKLIIFAVIVKLTVSHSSFAALVVMVIFYFIEDNLYQVSDRFIEYLFPLTPEELTAKAKVEIAAEQLDNQFKLKADDSRTMTLPLLEAVKAGHISDIEATRNVTLYCTPNLFVCPACYRVYEILSDDDSSHLSCPCKSGELD